MKTNLRLLSIYQNALRLHSELWNLLCVLITFLEPPKVCQDPLSGATGDPATHECLGCICEASSRFCKPDMGCVAGGTLCGPFLISRGFWIDAGRCKEGSASSKHKLNLKHWYISV